MNKVKNNNYLKKNYWQLFRAVVYNGTYDEIRGINDSKEIWAHLSGVVPLDSDLYFEIVRSSKTEEILSSYELSHGYRALEPEDYLKYLNNLVIDQHIDIKIRNNVIDRVIKRAYDDGYTYLYLIFQEAKRLE